MRLDDLSVDCPVLVSCPSRLQGLLFVALSVVACLVQQ